MTCRIRHCVECPKCRTRYLPGASPYANGSYLLPLTDAVLQEGLLYCACSRPAICFPWNWTELKVCVVSSGAHDRGYGGQEEIVQVARETRQSHWNYRP